MTSSIRPTDQRPNDSPFVLDDSEFPRVEIVFPPEFSDEEYRGLFDWYLVLHRRAQLEGTKINYLIDLRAVNPLTFGASRRKLAAENVERNREALQQFTLCEARVVSQSLTRGLLTAFDWLATQPWPIRNFPDRGEAEVWLTEQMYESKAAPRDG